MKKLLLIVTALLALFIASNAMAAWTITAVFHGGDIKWSSDHWVYRIKVSATSDGADPAEFNLSTYLTGINKILGGYLWQIETDPGTAPDAVWAVSFDTGLGASILDLSGLSVSATELHDGSEDLGFNPIIFDDIQIDIGDIGSANDSVDIYIVIVK